MFEGIYVFFLHLSLFSVIASNMDNEIIDENCDIYVNIFNLWNVWEMTHYKY